MAYFIHGLCFSPRSDSSPDANRYRIAQMFLVLNKIATEGQNFKMAIKSGIIEAAGEALNQKGIKKELAL